MDIPFAKIESLGLVTPPPPFPVNALPTSLAEFVGDVSNSIQIPVDAPAMMALAAIGLLSSSRFNVNVGGYYEPLNIYVACILPPGSRKSATFNCVMKPLAEENDRRRSARVDAPAEGEGDLDDGLGQLYCSGDTTPEKLAEILCKNHGIAGVMDPDAGGIFDMMAGRYGGKPNLQVYLKGHAGDELIVERRRNDRLYTRSALLTILLAVQPTVIRQLFTQRREIFQGTGLMGRFLYSQPPSLVGWREVAPRTLDANLQAQYTGTMHQLINMPALFSPDGEKKLLRELVMNSDALATHRENAQRIEEAQREGGILSGDLTEWASKMAGAVARIAGILHVYANMPEAEPHRIPIAQSTIVNAWRIGDYLKDHMLAIAGAFDNDPNVGIAEDLLGYLKMHGLTRFTVRALHQNLRRLEPEEIQAGLALLERRGYVGRVPAEKKTGAGRTPSPTFEINPALSQGGTVGTSAEETLISRVSEGLQKTGKGNLTGYPDHAPLPGVAAAARHLLSAADEGTAFWVAPDPSLSPVRPILKAMDSADRGHRLANLFEYDLNYGGDVVVISCLAFDSKSKRVYALDGGRTERWLRDLRRSCAWSMNPYICVLAEAVQEVSDWPTWAELRIDVDAVVLPDRVVLMHGLYPDHQSRVLTELGLAEAVAEKIHQRGGT